MKRIGIVGFGFMGKMHFNNYAKIEGAEVVAICDIVQEKLSGKSEAAGNIAGTSQELDFTGIDIFTDVDTMFKQANLDAVSITLPTYLHKEYTIKALNTGLNVLCEKPMALNSVDCKEMVNVAEKSGKILQVGHCIRFWPEYAKAKEILDFGEYGELKVATFRRLSMTPNWAWNDWILDEKRSGGALLDLHIHDTDFVQYLFGMPKSVSTKAVKNPSGGYDHVVSQYCYEDEKVITAEGGWIMADSFGFQMSFDIILEKATIHYDCTRTPAFKVCPDVGDMLSPEVLTGDGYLLELRHFIKAISSQPIPEIITPEQSLCSVELIEAERKSAQSGEKVQLG